MASNKSDDTRIERINRLRNGVIDVIETVGSSIVRYIAEITSRWLTRLLFEIENPLAERFQRGSQSIIENIGIRIIQWTAPRVGDW